MKSDDVAEFLCVTQVNGGLKIQVSLLDPFGYQAAAYKILPYLCADRQHTAHDFVENQCINAAHSFSL